MSFVGLLDYHSVALVLHELVGKLKLEAFPFGTLPPLTPFTLESSWSPLSFGLLGGFGKPLPSYLVRHWVLLDHWPLRHSWHPFFLDHWWQGFDYLDF